MLRLLVIVCLALFANATHISLVTSLIDAFGVKVHVVLRECSRRSEQLELARTSASVVQFVDNDASLSHLRRLNNIWFVVDMECNGSYAFVENVLRHPDLFVEL